MGVVFSPSNFAREIAKRNRSTTFVEEAFSRGLKRETHLACSLQGEGFGLRKNLPLFVTTCFYKEDRVEKTSCLKIDVQKNTTFKWGPKACATFFLAGFDKRWWLRFQSW